MRRRRRGYGNWDYLEITVHRHLLIQWCIKWGYILLYGMVKNTADFDMLILK